MRRASPCNDRSDVPRTLAHRFRLWLAILTASLGVLAAAEAAVAGASARDLALEGKRQLEAGQIYPAMERFRASRQALEKAGAGVDAELAAFLGLHLYNLGVRFNNDGDPQRALTCFTEALRVEQLSPRALDSTVREQLHAAAVEVGDYLVSTGKPQPALETFLLLARAPGSGASVWLGLGAARLAMGQVPEAAQAYEKAGALQPDSAEAAAGLGRVALRLATVQDAEATPEEMADRQETAVDHLRRARELQPRAAARERELAAGLLIWSKALARSGQAASAGASSREALEAYRRAVALEPQSPWPRIDLATQLFKARSYEDALAQYAEVEGALKSLLSTQPRDRDAPAWNGALSSARENMAAASYNLAVDSLNRAQFAAAEQHLRRSCGAGPKWEGICRAFREAAHSRGKAFVQAVATHEATLATEPSRAAELLALGDLYADVEDYSRAAVYYERLRSSGAGVARLEDRIAAVRDPGSPKPMSKTVQVPGGSVDLTYYRAEAAPDLETAVKAAWLRVTTALGSDGLRGQLAITVYPNKRAFRQGAGYRVGSLVKGNYTGGRISVYETPSHTLVEWVSVLTHEMTHHVVERISGGGYPGWFSEGLARYVEGDHMILDRDRVKARLAGSGMPALAGLDDRMDQLWNDSELYLDGRDAGLLAVAEMAHRRGLGGLKQVLQALAAHPGSRDAFDSALRKVLGMDLAAIDRTWRAALLGPG